MLEAVFFRADGKVERIAVKTGAPLRDPDVMLRLLHQKLDALADPLDPGFGFDLIRLEALLAEETKPATVSFDSDENARWQIALPGRPAVGALRRASGAAFRAPGHPYSRSRRAWRCRRRIAISHGTWVRKAPATAIRRAAAAAVGKAGGNQRAFADRAGRPAAALSAGGSAAFDVARAEGPERIAMEWWRKEGLDPRLFPGRNHAKASVSGFIATGFIARPILHPRWYLQGIFA